VFETYWRFAARRQQLFMHRVAGDPPPWTDDPVLMTHRFTNAYRASDRVSQFLIRHVLYEGEQSSEEVFFRALLFKLFNRIETWEALAEGLGTPAWKRFNYKAYAHVLDGLMRSGQSLYSAAYIMPQPAFGEAYKHRNHLRLLEFMIRDGAPARVERAHSLSAVFEILRSYPSLGGFLAFQFAIDLNYSDLLHFSEMDFVVAGPGARGGIRKCFEDTGDLSDSDIIRAATFLSDQEFERLGLRFETLWGRPLHLIDCQNLFCEVDKYARVAHPEFTPKSGRTRIKQRFVAKPGALTQWYPPKWGIDVPTVAAVKEQEG
jgi:alpha-glutamyl/putrescinyl thymine pyrophosphorylase clade 1